MTKPGLEIMEGARPAGKIRAAVFDFDDTLSLLRSGWQRVMIDQALEVLAPLLNGESEIAFREYVADYVDQLTGLPTIHQMARLAEEVTKHGGLPLEPESYKEIYTERLRQLKDERISAILSGAAPRSAMTVCGAKEVLQSLAAKGITLILASGTDDEAVQREIRLLDLHSYFERRIYGAPPNDPKFSKGRVLDDMIQTLKINGTEIVGFGDGVVEIRETRRVGGFAIGVAKWSSDNPADFARHRSRLIEAGAQAIIPDYEQIDAILTLLGFAGEVQKC